MVLSHPSHPSHPSSKVTVGDQNTKIISRRFVDIDDFTQQMQSFSQVCMTQLSLHSLQSDVWLAALGGVQFVFIKSSCPIFISGDKPRDAIAFACLLEPTGPPIISHGRPMAHQTLGGFDPTREAKFVLPSQAYYVAFQIQRDLLHQYLQIMGRFDLDERFWRTNYISLPETITSVKNYLNQILYLIQHQSSLLRQSHIKTLLMDDFIPLLINAIPPGSPEERDLPLPMSRSLLVEQAHDYMLSHLEEPITIKDLCQALYVSHRPLFYGFQEIFGIGPMEYLKIQRLQRVHRCLKTSTPEATNVTAIAQRYGFWSPGHFSRDYKKMFGQSPSQTLRSSS